MKVSTISRLEHLQKDPTIKNGLFYCPKCEVIMSSYYLRTFSVDCVRGVNFGRCSQCRDYESKNGKRLSKGIYCPVPTCNKRLNNYWERLCGERLRPIELGEFKLFCQQAIVVCGLDVSTSSEMIEELYQELYYKDFVSFGYNVKAGIDYKLIIILVKEKAKNFRRRKDARVVIL